ncbi:MAG: PolC-type DNA polymerase III, partial [Fusobacteriaceae bacterium]
MAKDIKIRPQEDIFHKIGLKEVRVKEIRFNKRHRRLVLKCLISSVQHFSEIDILEEKIKKSFGNELVVTVKIEIESDEITREDLHEIVERAIKKLKEKSAVSRSFLYFYRVIIESDKITVELNDQTSIDTLKEAEIDIKLKQTLSNMGVSSLEIDFKVGDFTKKLEEQKNYDKESLIKLHKRL